MAYIHLAELRFRMVFLYLRFFLQLRRAAAVQFLVDVVHHVYAWFLFMVS
jgi:hypothetical protein